MIFISKHFDVQVDMFAFLCYIPLILKYIFCVSKTGGDGEGEEQDAGAA
jgi:hypothetical protein